MQAKHSYTNSKINTNFYYEENIKTPLGEDRVEILTLYSVLCQRKVGFRLSSSVYLEHGCVEGKVSQGMMFHLNGSHFAHCCIKDMSD